MRQLTDGTPVMPCVPGNRRRVSCRRVTQPVCTVHRDSRPTHRAPGAASAARRTVRISGPAAHGGVRGVALGSAAAVRAPRMPRTWRRRLPRAPAARRRPARGRDERVTASLRPRVPEKIARERGGSRTRRHRGARAVFPSDAGRGDPPRLAAS